VKPLALIAVAGAVLTGCGGAKETTPAPKHYPFVVHLPPIARAPHRLSADVQFLSRTRLGIVTYGSSSCPSVPDELVVASPHRIRLNLTVGRTEGDRLVADAPPGGVCTADYGPTSMVLTIDPTLVDVHRPLTVRLFFSNGRRSIVRVAAPLSG
jgi:hypothetical protein